MKIRISREHGAVVPITLVIVVVIGVTLASYLDMVSFANRTAMRSQQWNLAIPVLEAGIEEALTHLNYQGTNLDANGWALLGGVFQKEREIGDSKYVVTISGGIKPVIISKAYVRVPLGTNFIEPPRTVKVTVTNAPTFARGMVAKGQIDLSGNRIKTDSFDSGDPSYSNNGRYDDGKAKDNGDVATNSSVIDSLNVWNADIFGRASTGPGGTVTIGPNGAVGSKAWHDGNNKGIEPGWANDDMNVHFPDVKPPFAGGAATPSSGTVGGVTYTYVLSSGNWELSSLTLAGSDKVLVTGNAVLYVTGSVTVTGNAFIKIDPSASLNLYVGGAGATLGGSGVINESGNANNFYYWGLNGNTSVAISGNASFTGVIYAPYAALTLGGGGSDDYDFAGASISDSVKMNGHYKFHYDENLGRVGPFRGYVVESWNEIFTYTEL